MVSSTAAPGTGSINVSIRVSAQFGLFFLLSLLSLYMFGGKIFFLSVLVFFVVLFFHFA